MRGFWLGVLVLASTTIAHADVNTPDSRGWTPLMDAAEMGKVDEIKALLAKGANIELGSPQVYDGATPLLIALEFSQHDAAMLLLDKKASVAGDVGTHAMVLAARGGFDDIIDRLLKAKVSPKGTLALELAAKYGYPKTINKLVKAGAEVNAVDKDDHDYTPFIVACQNRQVAAAKALLDAGANVNQVDADGTSALHWAVFAERPDEMHIYPADDGPHDTIYRPHETAPLVEMLVARNVKLNVVDSDKNTALHQAAMMDAAAAAKVLLKAGVDATAKNKQGFTAFELAKERNNSVMPVLGPPGTPAPPPRPPIINRKTPMKKP